MNNSINQRERFCRAAIGCLLAALLIVIQPAASGQDPKPDLIQEESLIKERTSVVTVNVSVIDRNHRQIGGLTREHFEIYEDKVKQQIDYFSDEDKPLSVGILFDLSGSMKSKLGRARAALKAFVQSSHNNDDFFLVGFNETAQMLSDFTSGETVLDRLATADPDGRTALYDAAYLGVEKVKQGRHDKRAILIISDGQDNSSRYNYGELRKLLKESDVQIYCIGITEEGPNSNNILDRQGQLILDEIAKTTGGFAFFPQSGDEMEDAITRIALVLRHQYSLGYVPLNEQRDGKWRKIKVRILKPKGFPSFIVRAREGYYATP